MIGPLRLTRSSLTGSGARRQPRSVQLEQVKHKLDYGRRDLRSARCSLLAWRARLGGRKRRAQLAYVCSNSRRLPLCLVVGAQSDLGEFIGAIKTIGNSSFASNCNSTSAESNLRPSKFEVRIVTASSDFRVGLWCSVGSRESRPTISAFSHLCFERETRAARLSSS